MTQRVRGAIAWDQARLIHITATTPHGFAAPDGFPVPLDGILAAASRRQRLGGLYGSIIDHHTEQLPLAVIGRHLQLASQWVWAASCAQWPDQGRDVRYWHQRFDDRAAVEVVDKMPASTNTGRYKPWRMPLPVVLTDHAEWWACGDPGRVRELLADVAQIGKKRSQGEGLVTGWTVTDAGPADIGRVIVRDGRPARPLPARAASHLAADGCDIIRAATRPPYWRAAITPDGTRQWREVIAPWVQISTPSAYTAA